MKIRISFDREITLANIASVKDYFMAVEQQLTTLRVHELNEIEEKLAHLGLDHEDFMAEWSIANQQHEGKHQMMFVNFFRFSTIVLLYILIESNLETLSKSAKKVRKISTPVTPPSKDIISYYKRYLTKECNITSLDWEIIDEINKIRNCIVHRSGKTTGSKHQNFFVQLSKRDIGFHVSSEFSSYPDDILPLNLENETIILENKYCLRAIDKTLLFFQSLCDAIPLPKFAVYEDKNL